MSGADMELIERLSAGLMRELAGQPPDIQGAVLADCLSMWLAGHEVRGDAKATEALRRVILEHHCNAVRALVPVNAELIGTVR